MEKSSSELPARTVGLDVGDRRSELCELNGSGHVVRRATVATTPAAMAQHFREGERCRVVLEAGTHSPWISQQLADWGHEVIVANPTELYGARRRKRRNDRLDAEFLARQGRADVALLHPIRHRSPAAHGHLALLRARDQLVTARTALINHVRGATKPMGTRLPKCSSEAFARRVGGVVAGHVAAFAPLVTVIEMLTAQIAVYDRRIAQLVATEYPVAQRLQAVPGVGPLTALAFVLLIDDPTRFRRSRDVGAFLGLVPRLDSSGTADPQLRITKAGDALGRRLLVTAAQYILGVFGPPCDLRRYGEAIASRGGTKAKKRAVVAVARKLAVLLHHLWVTDRVYDPEWLAARRGLPES